MTRRLLALVLSGLLIAGIAPGIRAAGGSISGTAKDEARKPYGDYTVRVREIIRGGLAGTTALDEAGSFALLDLPPTQYIVELVDRTNKVVCTDGPFDLAVQPDRIDVKIDCNKVPAAWWLLGAAAAAGITAAIPPGVPAGAAK